jgi:hypothetical protein
MIPALGHVQIAGLAAIRAVVHAIITKPDVFHGLAERTILLTGALCFGFVALRANDDSRHELSFRREPGSLDYEYIRPRSRRRQDAKSNGKA